MYLWYKSAVFNNFGGGGALSTETPSTTKTALISFTCSLAYQQIKFAPPPPPNACTLPRAHTYEQTLSNNNKSWN